MRDLMPWDGHSVVPLLVVDQLSHLSEVLHTLVAEGMSIVEIGLRTSVALDAIALASEIPGLTVGAGTVLDVDSAKAAVDAGASFGVSPSSHPEIMGWALDHPWPYIPGIATPTEAHLALDAGFHNVKVYPAARLGGVEFIEALWAVFPTLRFMPSGGVSDGNAREYLDHPGIFAVSGSWLTPRTAVNTGDLSALKNALSRWRTG
jgi:2-dehydro-3-deoxyphosphogluconate aldolase/(4S)-4-hydroxy-2-oxoglutarate aldolase